MEIDKEIKKYEPEIRKIAFWYKGLWSNNSVDVDDLISAGREAVWQVSEKRPDKIDYPPYVKGAIRFHIINRAVELTPKIPRQIYLIRKLEQEVFLIDTLPAYDESSQEFEAWDELEYYIRHEFSQQAAESLLKVAEKCDSVFDLNLSKPPPTDEKDKMSMVTQMDLSDNDLLTYASLLTGAIDRFPRGFVNEQKERGSKYLRFLLTHLDMTPQEFANSHNKTRILKKYGLDSFYQKAFDNDLGRLFADIFPEIEPYEILEDKGRWQGVEGLINAWNAIDRLKRETRKAPKDITESDFRKANLEGLLKALFDSSSEKAIEFRYLGTYPELTGKVNGLMKKMLEQRFSK